MKNNNNKESTELVAAYISESKFIKVGGIVIAIVIGFYLLGHIFKVTAHTIRGYNDLSSALKGQ